ncbi:hypothetical protein MNBD_GAMMA10-2794 [hydrothermal vent metagenome]|uniref:Uncharacterized protein n=1 Tax=hydrothermal vent metagenome TaxID=652676 RepID=A0A3B0YC84_9ZZZZ
MNLYKFISILCFAIFFMGSTTINAGQSESKKTPPSGIQIARILLKNGNLIGDGCDTVTDGPTLKDKLISLVFPETTNEQIIVTYHCIDDKRETQDTHQLVPVWNCSITGQVMENEINQKPSDKDINRIVTPATIVAYLNKKNMDIIDLLCF